MSRIQIKDLIFSLLCAELRYSFTKITVTNYSKILERHYELKKYFLKKYPGNLGGVEGFLSEFARSCYNTYYKE